MGGIILKNEVARGKQSKSLDKERKREIQEKRKNEAERKETRKLKERKGQ